MPICERRTGSSDNDWVRVAQALVESDPDRCVKLCSEVLNREPDNAQALFFIGTIMTRAGKHGLGAALLQRVTQLAPQLDHPWANLGSAYQHMGQETRARQMFQEAAKRAPGAYDYEIATTYSEQGEWHKAIRHARRALERNPEHDGAKATIGVASLALGDWEAGWKGYEHTLAGRFRKEIKVADEPRWDGSKGRHLFVYGEQGIGEEVMFASCIADAVRDSASVVLECDPRLEGLFRRSFPNVSVYGTRLKQGVEWVNHHRIDAGVGCGGLPKFYRPSPTSCPGTPYLVADPERRLQWRALLDALGDKPKIGICWSGGRRWTKEAQRAVGLESFRPLMEAIDADWISLQYKDPSREIEETGLPVKHWRRAVESDDYDDTAGLVAELDMVIGVHTAAIHLAGALGVPSVALVPVSPIWIWETPMPGDVSPWYRSVRRFRQKPGERWAQTIARLANDSDLDRLRRTGSSGVARVRAKHHRDGERAGGDQAADARQPEVVPEPLGRHQQLHHLKVLDPIAGGLHRMGAVL